MISVTSTWHLDTPARRAAAIALLAAILLAAWFYALKASEHASAIIRWRDLIQSVARGENVYNEWTKSGSFPNPPIAGLLLWPLTLLPPVASGLVWFALKLAMAATAIRWSVTLAAGDNTDFSFRSLLLLLVLAGRPILSDLQHGNVNILILFIVTAALFALRYDRDWCAGTLIGLATAIKVTPALFIPYFAYKRRWNVVAGSAAGLVLFALVVPGFILGFERNWWLIRSWSGAMIEPYLFEGQVETLQHNQSLPAVWLRLVTDCRGVVLSDGSTRSVNFVSMDPAWAKGVLRGMVGMLIVCVAWLARDVPTGLMTGQNDTPPCPPFGRGGRSQAWPRFGRGGRSQGWRPAAEYALVFMAMLLVSERSWKHHFVTMVLPYAVVLAAIHRPNVGPRLRTALRVCLVLSFLAMASTSSELGGWLAGGDGAKYAQAYGLFCVSAILVFAAVSLILCTAQRAASAMIGSSQVVQR